MKILKIVSVALALSGTSMFVPSLAAVENAQIESLYFTDDFNNVVLDKAEGRYIPNVVIKKDSGNRDFTGTKCVVAVYDKDRRIHSLSLFEVDDLTIVHSESIYGFDRMTIQGGEVAYPDGGYAKAFLFDDLDNINIFANATDDMMALDRTQYTGEITFNSYFENLINNRFDITKQEGIRQYAHNAEPEKLYDFKDATEVFISSNTESDLLPFYQYGRSYDESALVGGLAGTTVGGSCFQGPVWFYQYTDEVLSCGRIDYHDFVAGVYGSSALRWKLPDSSSNYPCIINFGYLWGQGNNNDTVITFKAPYSGTVRITGTPYNLSEKDTDGLSYRISKNDNTQTIFPLEKREGVDLCDGWSYYHTGIAEAREVDCIVDVKKGDCIRFMASSNGSSTYGDFKWAPVIEYVVLKEGDYGNFSDYQADAKVTQYPEDCFYIPYDSRKADNIISLPVDLEAAEGEKLEFTVSDTTYLEWIGDKDFKVKKFTGDAGPLTILGIVSDARDGSIIRSKEYTAYNVKIMGLTKIISREEDSNSAGTERDFPISAAAFAKNINNGIYKDKNGEAQKDFIITITDDFYSGDISAAIPVGTKGYPVSSRLPYNINALIRSGAPGGFTWLGRLASAEDCTETWEKEGNIYKKKTENLLPMFPVNFEDTDQNGMPRSYNLATGLDTCMETSGSYYQDDSFIYVNPFERENMDNLSVVITDNTTSTAAALVSVNGYNRWKGTVIFENIGFMPATLNCRDQILYGEDYSESCFAFFGCKFYRGMKNALQLGACYNAWLFDCVSAYAVCDGLGYHGVIDNENKKVSSVAEINCKSYHNGGFNNISGAQPTNNSNNASTAHDSMYVLRIGGKYWDCQGGVVADVDTQSITMGCEIYGVTPGALNMPAAYEYYNSANCIWENPKKYLIDCLATGTFLRHGVIATNNTYTLDICGMKRSSLINYRDTEYEMLPITWEEIANADWKET